MCKCSQVLLAGTVLSYVVFTLPSKLRDIAYQNKRVVYDLLMKAAAETTLSHSSPSADRG